MAEKESYRQRQINELEVIQSIFGSDVRDLRDKNGNGNGWRPLDLSIKLLPQKGSSGNREAYVRTNLRIICPSKYPKVSPKISLEETIGLSDAQKTELLQELQNVSQQMKGEVMIYDLTQVVQAYLHKHNKPPAGSFYDQMVIERTKRDEALMKQRAQKLSHEQRIIRDEVLKRKEILRNEDRFRRETRRSMSESSPTHRLSNSTDLSENSSGIFREHIYPNECDLHMCSEDLYFPSVGKKVHRGCCLGHSKKGCIAYSGIDAETGQLLYITEWMIKFSQLETKCTINCQYDKGKCVSHSMEEIVQSIEKHTNHLSHLNHKNLISYEFVNCMKKKDSLLIHVGQEFVLGTNISSISSSIGWSYTGASNITRGILDALIFLHNKGISHNNLDENSVFMDNSGVCRVTDFSLIPYLCYLNGTVPQKKGDLPAIGFILESLLQLPNPDMYDFIEICKSERTLSASDLLEHPFLMSCDQGLCTSQTVNLIKKDKPVDELTMPPAMTAGHSRLQTEFEVQQWLGQGAYGDVLKVKNILDNRQYAIKRIPLTSRSRQIYKKMTREVELLSRLNHENVVRYFNSWIERASEKDLTKYNFMGESGEESEKSLSIHPNFNKISKIDESNTSDDWIGISANNLQDSSSDGVQFVNSDGEVVELEEDSESISEDIGGDSFSSPKHEIQIMYIQMEFCEKSTLRTAIDSNLYSEPDRMWRLFREITEGLAHIHSQGMIHRDLKPVNIFLDSRDQVKIGDFGLATTNFLALQQCQEFTSISHGNRIEVGSSQTGKVGTALYVAPELMGKASKSTYNQKVDLYSLGIIFFEMSHRPFSTGMERVETLAALRSPNVIVPANMLNNLEYTKNIKVIKWLLNHDQSKRPTAEELLTSDLLPPQRLEDNELQEFLRHVLANPQSKTYKHLVARCLAQECDEVLELTYHLGSVSTNPMLELIKTKIVSLFRKHGGIEVVTPLLSPFVRSTKNNIVRLMTHSGAIVKLPHDLRIPFIKHAALNGVNIMRRYSVERVYREKKVFNFHPKQLYECAFDIITPASEGRNRLIDAELIFLAYELTSIVPVLNQRNLSFKLNHSAMLKAIFMYNNVPFDKWAEILSALNDFIDHRISKFQLHSTIMTLLETSKHTATSLIDTLLIEFQLGGPKGFYMNSSILRNLIRGHSEASALAKLAMEEIEHVVSLAHGLGVMCPINFHSGFSTGFERAKSGGIIWQLLAEIKTDRKSNTYGLGIGGRYDDMLSEFQKQALRKGILTSVQNISGAGLSFALDKIVNVLNICQYENPQTIDIVLCVVGARPNYREVTHILRELWVSGIQCAVVESNGAEDGQDLAKDLGATYYLVYSDDGSSHLRSWINDKFEEKILNRDEIISYIKKILRPETSLDANLQHSTSFTESSSSSSIVRNGTSKSNVLTEPKLPSVDITFITIEKMTASSRRRYENSLTHHMSTALLLFNKSEEVAVIAVDLHSTVVRAIVGAIDPRGINEKEISNDIKCVIERFPENKRYIKDVVEEIIDIYMDKKRLRVICIYCLKDSYYRFIL